MIPNKDFVKDLKNISRDLDVIWSPYLERWCIFYKAQNKVTYRVTEVQEDDGSYRPLDRRTLDKLREWDSHRNSDEAEVIAKKQYDNYYKEHLRRNLARSEEKRYKGKQLVGFWKRAAEKMLENKQYNLTSVRPLLRAAEKARMMNSTSATLLGKLGMPHLKGEVLNINPSTRRQQNGIII